MPVLVSKLDSEAERLQVTLGMIISKLLGEILRIKEKNPNVNLDIDTEILRIFSDQFRSKEGLLNFNGGQLSDNIHKVYGFYDNFLSTLGGSSLSKEQELMYTAALEERLLVASLVGEANLQIKKAQEISNQRAEAFKILQQSYLDLTKQFDGLESKFISRLSSGDQGALKEEFNIIRGVLKGGLSTSGSFESIKGLNTIGSDIIFEHHTGDLKDFAIIQTNGQRSNYGSIDKNMVGSSILSSIYGGFDNNVFVRLESAFRAIEKENQLLRDKYIRWQTDRPNVHGVEDRNKIIDTLEKKIVELSS